MAGSGDMLEVGSFDTSTDFIGAGLVRFETKDACS